MKVFRTCLAVGILVLCWSCTSQTYTTTGFSDARIEVDVLSPTAGSPVDYAGRISATLNYTIDQFKIDKNRYFASLGFETTTPGTTTLPLDVNEGRAQITDASGTVTVSYSLHSLRQLNNGRELVHPLRVHFTLHERSGPKGRSRVIAETEFFEFLVHEGK